MDVVAWYATTVFPVGPPRDRHLTFEQLESRLPMSAVGLGQSPLAAPPQTPGGVALVSAPQNSAASVIIGPQLQALYDGTLANPSRLLFDSAGHVGVELWSSDIGVLLPKLESLGFQPMANPTPVWLGGYGGYLPVQSIGQMASLGPDGLTSIYARLAPNIAPILKQLAAGTATDTSQVMFDAEGRLAVMVYGFDMQSLLPKLQAVGFQPLANPNDPWWGPGVSGYLPIDAIDQVASWADDGLAVFEARFAPNVDAVLKQLAASDNVDTSQLMFDSAGRVAVGVDGFDQQRLDAALASVGFIALPNPSVPGVPGESGYLPVAALKQITLLADAGMGLLVARYRAFVDRALSELADGQTANTSGLVFDSSGRVGVYIQAADYGRLLPVLEQMGFVPGGTNYFHVPGEPGFIPVSALNDIELLTDNGLIGIVGQYATPTAMPGVLPSASPAPDPPNDASLVSTVALSPTLVNDEPALPPVAAVAPATASQSGPPVLAGPATNVAKTSGTGLTAERDGD